MNIEIKNSEVFRDGEQVGIILSGDTFEPVPGLHHKTIEKIRKQLSELQGGEVASRLAHNQEIEGSIPSPATTSEAFTTTPSYAAKTKVQTIADSDPQPERGELGDIAPDLIEWRKRNWPMDAFSELYPPHRLKALNREDLI